VNIHDAQIAQPDGDVLADMLGVTA